MSSTSVLGGVVRRREDPALIQGRGRYTDDVKLAGTAHVAFVRSPYAHAQVGSVDTSAAAAMEGVLAVYTAADTDHLGPLIAQVPVGALRPLLNSGTVKHVGEAVAMVVADDPYVAKDAADAVEVDYEPLPAVVDLKQSLSDEVPVHEGASNTLISWVGPFGADEAALAELQEGIEAAKQGDGAVVVSQEMTNQRLIPVPIEPRSVMADYQAGYDRFDIYSSTQIPSALAGAIGKYFGMSMNQVTVKAMEVGGGFGCKLNVYNDEVLVAFASKQLGRPVKWTETRREAANSTIQGRGWVATATVTGTEDGEILGFELEGIADMGAYSQNFTVAIPFLGLFVGSGQYGFPTYWKMDCVTTHTMTTDAYRGAGRPEAAYYLERIIDMYARRIGMDPAEVRRKNYISASEFPGAVSPMGFPMDTGDYATNLDAALETAGWSDLLAERDAARAEGRYVGVGLATYVEVCGFGPSGLVDLGFSWAEYQMPSAFNGSSLVRVHPDGSATVSIGTGPSGQGHQTTWAQIVGDGLGLEVDRIRVIHGDTEEAPPSIGTFGSRSAAVDGAACYQATGKVRAKAARIAAHMLEASEEDIEFADGGAHVAGAPDSSVSWGDIAACAYQPHRLPEGMEGGLEAHAIFSPGNATWPFGTHIAVVEVDPDTGDVDLLRYIGMDDCGNVISPMIVDGQIHGGIAQGIGQAMFEDAVYDADGNLLSGSLVDYILPTAADLPSFELDRTVTPTDINPLGVKGIGEAGTIGSAHTVVNAVVDALEPLGVTHIDMPLRPRRVWQAIQDARA
ncbi:xanthine dehydrogenase family protein molybdopterin-binding subunit [Candidatus Spongiisocius sp.]|uniref:xanthine dehydrogenase family protein molybdopterin-binding subunit n=1 Tax=Candidatus Spongiisocius sp. TaxID=3101273 RepID=UPI003B5C6161